MTGDTDPNAPANPGPGSRGSRTRRAFLRDAAAAGFAVGGSGLVTGLSGVASAKSLSPATVAGQTPTRGGLLRVGIAGNGTSETYNPALAASPVDFLHCNSVYDLLVRPAPNYSREPGLILDWVPNADATVYELKLRQDVRWQDGKPFGADDIIYTLRFLGRPSNLGNSAVANVYLNDLKKLGQYTVRVPLKIPIADLAAYFLVINPSYVVQNGATKFSKPVGTGAYKLESFTPGQQSSLSANRDYWDQPRPYPDELEIISINDDTARVNALLGGEIDICCNVPFADAKANLTNGQFTVVVGAPGEAFTIYMSCDTAPFNDVRVRQAMKLIVNRPQMIEEALSGFGTPGNDLMGYGVRFYDKSLPQREQDLEQAKSLLKAAGASNLRVILHTAPVEPGFVSSATVLAQQATAAGVSIQVKTEQVSNYFNPALSYLKESFAQDIWATAALNGYYSEALLSNSPINETHWKSASFDTLFYKAQGTLNESTAQSLWNQLQSIQWNEGGNIVWGLLKSTDGCSSRVRGFGAPGSGWLSGTDDQRVWNWGLS